MKIVGIILIGVGFLGVIQDWICRHMLRQKRMEELISFFRNAVYVMEETKTPWIVFFEEYSGMDLCVTESMREVAYRLKEHRYPKGELAWQAVICDRKEQWDFSKEAYELLFRSGCAFFGKSQKENLEMLRLYIQLFSECKKKEALEFAEKKKVWIPVGALGGLMLIIILL